MRHVNVISDPAGDKQLEKIAKEVEYDEHFASCLDDLGRILDGLRPGESETLDLTGHSSGNAHHQLKLGTSLITASDPSVIAFFRDRRTLLHDLRLASLRLLGCCTAESSDAQATIVELASAIDLPVFGAITVLSYQDYDAYGLKQSTDVYLRDQEHLGPVPPCPVRGDAISPIVVADVDVVAALPPVPWPIVVVARGVDPTDLFAKFEGHDGVSAPGLLVEPDVEILIPFDKTACRVVQVLFGGRFVRVFTGTHPYGVLYPTGGASVRSLLKAVMPSLA